MGVFGHLFGGGAADVVKAVGSAADSLFTSKEEKMRIELEEGKLELERDRLRDRERERQVEVNRAEARHASVFVAGWRPYIGWTCGAAMTYHFILFPVLGPFVEAYAGVELVDLDWQELSIVLMGMLGIGGYRSWERVKGVQRDTLKGPMM